MPWSPLPTGDGATPPPRRLADGLDRVLAGLGAPPADAVAALADRWAEVVGAEAAVALTLVGVEDGVLVTTTTQPAWASQARWMEAEVCRRAAAVVGPGVVSTLEVRVRRP